MKNNSTFGDMLKNVRLSRNLSQEEFASLLGTSKQVISRYETGQRIPKITTVQEYADKLNTPLSSLLPSEKDPAWSDMVAEDAGPYILHNEAEGIILPPDEYRLIISYRSLNKDGQEKIVDYIDDLVSSGKYIDSHETECEKNLRPNVTDEEIERALHIAKMITEIAD